MTKYSMGSLIETHVGADYNFVVALLDQNAEPITSFTSDDVPFAEVSSGGNLPVLWNPPAAWVDPATGRFTIQLSAEDSGNFDAGKYVIHNGVTLSTGERILAPDLDLTLLPSPSNNAVTPLVDVTYHRLLADAPWLSDDKTGDHNYAGYLGERGQARAWFVENVMSWYASWRERGCQSEGWYCSAPTISRMREYIENGNYVITDRIKRIQAAKAISLICANALTPSGKAGENQYQAVAKEMMNRANSLFAGLRVQVVNNADGVNLSFDDTSVYKGGF